MFKFKKILSLLICCMVLAQNVSVGDVYAKSMELEENSYKEDALSRYSMYLNEEKFNAMNGETFSNIDDSENTFSEAFSELNSMVDAKFSINLFSENTDENFVNIVKDENTGTLAMLQADVYNEELIFAVNDQFYKIIEESNGNIYILSSAGEKLPIVEVTEISSIHANNINEVDKNIMSKSSYTYGPYYNRSGPGTRTNKAWVDVLSVISLVSGGASLKIQHPILGVISFVSGTVAYAGDKLYVTLYIKYWHSYNSTYTWILEEEYYYNYNNYTGFVKQRTHEIWNQWS